VVTGSRIRQNPVDRVAPVQTATAADIDRSGEVSIADYLQRLPISGSAINRTNNSSGNLGFPPDGGGIGAGASEIDLRYLTSKRVLVLVDGKRWVRGSSASGVSGAVDLNTIPTAAIARIEVLQDGASPIYGSDAIAGVVNVITRSDYKGFEVETNQGQFDEGDGYTQDYSLYAGISSDRARAFLSVAFSDQEEVFARDRDTSSTPLPGFALGEGGTGSSGTPQGRFQFIDPRRIDNPATDADERIVNVTLNNGAVNSAAQRAAFNPANPNSLDFNGFDNGDRFNFQPFNFLSTPVERANAFAKGQIDLFEKTTLNLTAAFTTRESRNQAAPNPLFLGAGSGSGALLTNVFIPANQRFNPFGVDLDGRTNLLFLGRRPIEAGPRQFEQTVDSTMVSASAEGEFELAGRQIFWDTGINWGENKARQTATGIFNARKLALALGPEVQCQATPGCVPFNIFGGQGADGNGSITPEMLAFVTFDQRDRSRQRLTDVFANISGEVLELPAGPLGYAFGYEYRKEQGSFTPDAIVSAGDTADVPASPTRGEVESDELYLELRAPLVADVPFVKRLEFSTAVRYSDYTDIGSDEVFKAGIYWRVVEDLSVRANFAEGFRAPNIGELFNTGARFDSMITDPCSTTGALPANCASLGVPAGFQQANPQISVQTGGNLNLQPETSDTVTVGFAYNPSWATGSFISELTFDANYYDIELEDPIQALNAQSQLNNCVATLSPFFCGGIVRASNGEIIAFANQLTNIGRIETDGYDLTITLASEPTAVGSFRVQWSGTYLANYEEFTQGVGSLVSTQRAGREVGSPTRGFVRFKSSLNADWLLGSFTTSVSLRYLSDLEEGCPDPTIDGLCSNPAAGTNELGDRTYTDLQLSWSPPALDNKAQLSIGVNNVFNKEPPLCRTCDASSYDGTIYPIGGRFIHARAAMKF
jgi:iron complex outermembrane receptor protein